MTGFTAVGGHKLTEDLIERHVETQMDRLDRQFLNGAITEQVYSRAIGDLHDWAERQYNSIRQYA